MSAMANYRPLWLLLVAALLPLLLALVMYFGSVALPEGRLNHGTLVIDRPPLSSWPLQTAVGVAWQGRGHWQLLQVAARCEQACLRWRQDLVQLHKALGRERDRVQPQWVGVAAPEQRPFGSEPLYWGAPAPVVTPGIWLADPLGNLVLYYRFEQSPRELLQDLKRLLKLSKVG